MTGANGVRLIAVALFALATGCATPTGTYGTNAHFSPAFQGYVMSEPSGSDDPDSDATVLLLRDPLTGNKLRCNDEVVRWRELHEDLAVDLVHDENTAIAVGVSTGAAFAPLVAIYPMGGLVIAAASLTAQGIYDGMRSDDAYELLAVGMTLYERKRYLQTSQVIERALAKDPSVGIQDEAYLYLGLAYRAQGLDDQARLALGLFIDRAAVRDVNAYRKAEKALHELGVMTPQCQSTEPVELYW